MTKTPWTHKSTVKYVDHISHTLCARPSVVYSFSNRLLCSPLAKNTAPTISHESKSTNTPSSVSMWCIVYNSVSSSNDVVTVDFERHIVRTMKLPRAAMQNFGTTAEFTSSSNNSKIRWTKKMKLKIYKEKYDKLIILQFLQNSLPIYVLHEFYLNYFCFFHFFVIKKCVHYQKLKSRGRRKV